jgi:hypothetical protein
LVPGSSPGGPTNLKATHSELLQFKMSSFFHVALEVNVLVTLKLQNLTGFIWRCDFK